MRNEQQFLVRLGKIYEVVVNIVGHFDNLSITDLMVNILYGIHIINGGLIFCLVITADIYIMRLGLYMHLTNCVYYVHKLFS